MRSSAFRKHNQSCIKPVTHTNTLIGTSGGLSLSLLHHSMREQVLFSLSVLMCVEKSLGDKLISTILPQSTTDSLIQISFIYIVTP